MGLKSLPFQSLSCLLFGYLSLIVPLSFMFISCVYHFNSFYIFLYVDNILCLHLKYQKNAVGDACGNSQVIQMFLDALHILETIRISIWRKWWIELVNIQSVKSEASRVANGTAMESSLRGTRIVWWTKKIWETVFEFVNIGFNSFFLINHWSSTAVQQLLPQSVWFADAKISPSWQKEDKN